MSESLESASLASASLASTSSSVSTSKRRREKKPLFLKLTQNPAGNLVRRVHTQGRKFKNRIGHSLGSRFQKHKEEFQIKPITAIRQEEVLLDFPTGGRSSSGMDHSDTSRSLEEIDLNEPVEEIYADMNPSALQKGKRRSKDLDAIEESEEKPEDGKRHSKRKVVEKRHSTGYIHTDDEDEEDEYDGYCGGADTGSADSNSVANEEKKEEMNPVDVGTYEMETSFEKYISCEKDVDYHSADEGDVRRSRRRQRTNPILKYKRAKNKRRRALSDGDERDYLASSENLSLIRQWSLELVADEFGDDADDEGFHMAIARARKRQIHDHYDSDDAVRLRKRFGVD